MCRRTATDFMFRGSGSALASFTKSLGWTKNASGAFVIPPNPDNQIKATVTRETIALPRMSLSTIYIGGLFWSSDVLLGFLRTAKASVACCERIGVAGVGSSDLPPEHSCVLCCNRIVCSYTFLIESFRAIRCLRAFSKDSLVY